MDQPLPLVTVITPTYNQAQYLDQAIQSVLSQDYPRVEYIVLNDGSKDDTEAVLQKYTGRITWETQPNMGEYRTIHKGVSRSRGAYLMILSSDDYLLPGAIRALVEFMIQHPQYVVVYPDYDIVNARGELVQHVDNYDYDYANAVRLFACMPGPAALMRRETYEILNGRDTSYRFVGDFDFYLRAGLLGPFCRVPRTLAAYRWHSGSQTRQRSLQIAEEHLRLARQYFSNNPLPPSIRRLKAEAFSSAYYLAGTVCSDDPRDGRKRWYYLRAFLYKPGKYLREYRHRLPNILHSWFGPRMQRIILLFLERVIARRHR